MGDGGRQDASDASGEMRGILQPRQRLDLLAEEQVRNAPATGQPAAGRWRRIDAGLHAAAISSNSREHFRSIPVSSRDR